MLLALMTTSWKSRASKISTYSSSLAIISASKWPDLCPAKYLPNSSMRFCLSLRSMIEPSFTPIRMGILRSLHASMT